MQAKHERFAREYVVDHNAAQAAVRAGYVPGRAKQTGYRLLRRPDIAQLVDRLDAEKSGELGVSASYVAAGFKWYHEEAMAGRVPPAVGVKSLEGLAKLMGMFVQRSEVEHSGRVEYTLTLDDGLNEKRLEEGDE